MPRSHHAPGRDGFAAGTTSDGLSAVGLKPAESVLAANVAFKFSVRVAFIKFIGTHAQYDRGNAATISKY